MPPPLPHERERERGQPPRRRRMLSLPAVCPCEAIAPAPLLASLLSLAADVAGSGSDAAAVDALPALRGAAREAVRIAALLHAFLDAVRDDFAAAASDGDKAVVLGLSELHVALQKLRLLLGDLGRKGARLWVLMNAELAASELRVVMGSVATAVDVLLLPAAGMSVDARELAALVSSHAWRAAARLRPDAEDGRAARGVRSVLARFAGGATPDAEDARLVLARVGAAMWPACAEEAAFLEAELLERLETGGEDDNDLVLIAGLMALLLYCRVVLFDRTDDPDTASAPPVAAAAPRCAAAATAWVNPEALQCPITLELMTDPVTVSTGQTYDRASIKKWIRSGCRTCPVTGERLRSGDLVPNLAARGIVEQLLLSRGGGVPPSHEPSGKHRRAVDKTAAPFGSAAGGGARLAAAFLVSRLSRMDAPEQQRKAAHEARKLSKRNVFYRACLVDAGAVPWLLHLLSSGDATAQDNAVAALLNVSKHPAGRRALVESGGAGLVVDAASVAVRVEARQNAAAVLFYLSSNPEYCEEITRIPEAIPTLVSLARHGAYRGRKNALVSLYGLLQCPDAHERAVSAGAVPALAAILLGSSAGGGGGTGAGDRDEDLAVDAVALLARLAERPAGARAVAAASSELVTRLVDFVGESAPRSAKEHCASLLASLARHGGDGVLALLGKLPGLMPALYALIADGTPQAVKKARWLVNEIHRHYDQRQPPPPTADHRGIRV
ncbi:unnamed protein product [Urochloa decumbens]|uniref:RING-type E3 ubiquitin transferase n=1 Tax=Urochloa decumbens TaxID=240449 RepID=A0ABC9BUM1_9POAL